MNFLDHIEHNLHRLKQRTIISEIREGKCYDTSAAALLKLIAQARSVLTEAAIQTGERVVLLAANSVSWVAADLAILQHGAVSVPLYQRQSVAELAAILADCQPGLVLVSDAALARSLRKHSSQPYRILTLSQLFQGTADATAISARKADEVLTVVYTSGTSGDPKGVMLTQANFDHVVPAMAARIDELKTVATDDERVFHFLPFCFMPARLLLWSRLHCGKTLVLSENLEHLKEELRLVDPHYFLTVPLLLERIRSAVEQRLSQRGGAAWWLYRRAKQAYRRQLSGIASYRDRWLLALAANTLFRRIKQTLAPSLQLIVCGSAPLGVATQHWFTMIGIPVYQGYGLTETAGVAALDRLGEQHPGYVGQAIPGCEMKLSAAGELICRGPNIFAGYWNRAAETASVLHDGWLHTGDRAEVDGQGNWRIIGRLKHTLVPSSGHNVQPEPLEQHLREICSGIEQAVLVGHGRPFLSVLVYGSASADTIVEALRRCNKRLPHYQKIRRFYQLEAPLSPANGLLTANGKLRRPVIETQFQEIIDSLYR